MKKAIAMRCTKTQYEKISDMLKCLEINSITDFNEYPYLINCDGECVSNVHLGFDHIIKEYNPEIHETWNEKVFLEACGIETEPEYVITHNFPKGKDVCCNVVLSIRELKEVLKLCFEYGVEIHDNLIEKGFLGRYLCYGESIGIDKLCTCDSDHFTTFDGNVFSVSLEDFKAFIRGEGLVPEAFKEDKVELVVGKWYKYPDYTKWNFCITEIDHKSKLVKGFGFGTDGNWMQKEPDHTWDFEELEKVVEMTTEEVTEALTNEAVKRGFVEGVWFKLPNSNSISVCEHKPMLNVSNNQILYFGDYCIFKDGKWAEIIPTISKEEAEKELGKKILN